MNKSIIVDSVAIICITVLMIYIESMRDFGIMAFGTILGALFGSRVPGGGGSGSNMSGVAALVTGAVTMLRGKGT